MKKIISLFYFHFSQVLIKKYQRRYVELNKINHYCQISPCTYQIGKIIKMSHLIRQFVIIIKKKNSFSEKFILENIFQKYIL